MISFLKRFFSSKDNDHISAFNDQDEAHEHVKFIDHGTTSVDLDKIIGSVGKYHDFDSRFRPKKQVSDKRFSRIKKAIHDGRQLPPVQLYQIRSALLCSGRQPPGVGSKRAGSDQNSGRRH
ncbi:MAG: hypothetical protein U9P10_07420 [Thermodesulfobacteriota bacterium]|nr:hypothetical protein [Thermodesulfobacteriota bacterium]